MVFILIMQALFSLNNWTLKIFYLNLITVFWKPIFKKTSYMQEMGSFKFGTVHSLVGGQFEREWIHTRASQVVLVVKNMPAKAGDIRDMSSIPGLRRFSGGVHSNPLQYSYLENPMDRRAWQATVHRVAVSWTLLKRLSTLTQIHIYMYG